MATLNQAPRPPRHAARPLPEWSKAVKSATLAAGRSSIRGSGGASGGRPSPCECRAAQGCQARPEQAQ
eukprot:scaffold23591_cov58-Phaeocystis_antarctica.AAC.3